jgi:polyisoprenoid-binding protein YceI/protein-S-isoprenylcysteine O-methyltransferase Ste14
VTLALVIGLWRPIPGTVWRLEGDARQAMLVANGAAWVALVYSMSLMGLGYQTGWSSLRRYLAGQPEPRRAFEPRGAYRFIRHPIYVSFLLVSWTTPNMATSHLILSIGFTLYAVAGSILKDRRLAALVGEPYRNYMARVTGFPLAFGFALAFLVLAPGAARADDAARTFALGASSGELSIEVKKRGALKAFAHDHTIAAPIESGQVTWCPKSPAASTVALRVQTKKIHVVDPDFSDSDRAKVQKNMESDEVLDVAKYPEIVFVSEAVTPLEPEGATQVLSVSGKLTLHGVTRPAMIKVRITEEKGALVVVGEHVVKQSDFGMEPYSAVLGTVGVQDDVRVSWKLVLKGGGS